MTMQSVGKTARTLAALAVLAGGSQPVTADALEAQQTPESLVERFLEGVREQDRSGLRALIHPESEAALAEARIESAVDGWIERSVPADYELKWMEPAEVEEYDPESRTFDLGGLPLRFPVAPEKFFQVVASREQPSRQGGGEDGAVRVTGPEIVEAVGRHGGRWHLVLPTVAR